jgi:hypothetical protein
VVAKLPLLAAVAKPLPQLAVAVAKLPLLLSTVLLLKPLPKPPALILPPELVRTI